MSEPKTLRVPRDLFKLMRTAIREGAKDSRREDRVLHDATRDLLVEADDEVRDFIDARVDARSGD